MSSSHLNSMRDVHGRAPLTAGHHRIVEGNDRYIGRAGIARAIIACDGASRHMEPSPKQKIISMLMDTHRAGDSKDKASIKKVPIVAEPKKGSLTSGLQPPTAAFGSVREDTNTTKLQSIDRCSKAFTPEQSQGNISNVGSSGATIAKQGAAQESRWMAGGEVSVFLKDQLLRLLAVQAVLLKFRDPAVRRDFSNGLMESAECSGVQLQDLDELADMVLPGWGPNPQKDLLATQNHLLTLISLSSEPLLLTHSKNSKTYLQWHKIISSLASSNYWSSEKFSTSNPSDPNQVTVTNECSPTSDSDVQMCDSTTSFAAETKGLDATDRWCRAQQVNAVGDKGTYINQGSVVDVLGSDCGLERKNSTFAQYGLPLLPCSPVPGPASVNLNKPIMDKSTSSRPLPLSKSAGCEVTPATKFVPECSVCGGRHLGMHCRALRLQLKCHWCGRTGHNEGSCWRKSGACLICGSANHRLRQCARYIPLKQPVFPPWCLLCGSNHLGSDCDSPYME